MGTRLQSMAGLRAALGYRLCILTFGVVDGSPEAEAVRRNFPYMCDALGNDGMLVTGGYDREFWDDPTGFLTTATETLYGFVRPEDEDDKELPKPALIALRATHSGTPEVAYFSIKGFGDQAIVEVFRAIMAAPDEPGAMERLPGNLLGEQPGIGKDFWAALQLKPGMFGVGLDLKAVIERVYVRVWNQRQWPNSLRRKRD